MVDRYRDQRKALATEWSLRGENDLPRRPGAAVVDFQTALSYGPAREEDRFRLAQALVAANRPAEAKAQLLTLILEDPGRGDLNLELARLAAHTGDVTGAVRYYHAAIDGSWQSGAAVARRQARIELARFLMMNGQQVRAQAELIGVIDDLPRDAAIITDVAMLLVQAGAQARALGLLRRAIDLDPHDARAEQLAGSLEFAAGDFRSARRDLLAAARQAPLSPADRQTLEAAERVFELDPYRDRLGIRARAERATRALAIAKQRLERCGPVPELMERVDEAMKRTAVELQRDPDLIDDTMSIVFDVERLPPGTCGTDSTDDRALAALASQHSTQSQ